MKHISTVYEPDFDFGECWGIKSRKIFAPTVSTYTVKYLTVNRYWRGQGYQSIRVEAKNETQAEFLAIDELNDKCNELRGEGIGIYDITVSPVKGTERLK